MNQKFITVPIPCKDCLVQAACKKKIPIKVDDFYQTAILVPKWNEKEKVYKKGLIECWVDMGTKIRQRKDHKFPQDFPQHAQIAFLDALIEIINFLEYIVDSTSWRDGKRYQFDIDDLKEKLERVDYWLNARR